VHPSRSEGVGDKRDESHVDSFWRDTGMQSNTLSYLHGNPQDPITCGIFHTIMQEKASLYEPEDKITVTKEKNS
jgi:hypothetical protein